jgi:anti-sigma regulatory factor (Ser/Thr protein kinase)
VEVALKIRPSSAQQRFLIDDGSKVGEVRRAAQTLATYELTAEVAGKVSIAATELANNLLNHAGGGELLLQRLGTEESPVIELLAIDRGPGMTNLDRCMRDGYSTTGTPGTGLGAVRRLASEFDIHSAPGEGTVVMARFGDPMALRYGGVNVAYPGEIDSGDAWHIAFERNDIAVMVVDGLGHGTLAAEAARTAIAAFSSSPFDAPIEIMTRANALMSKTRGGAAACARLSSDRLSYVGIGNISGSLVSTQRSQGLVSHNGTLGMHQRRSQPLEYTRDPGAILVMHSDGVSARWDLKRRPDLLACHPAIVAAAIYREHARGSDDATVVVVA